MTRTSRRAWHLSRVGIRRRAGELNSVAGVDQLVGCRDVPSDTHGRTYLARPIVVNTTVPRSERPVLSIYERQHGVSARRIAVEHVKYLGARQRRVWIGEPPLASEPQNRAPIIEKSPGYRYMTKRPHQKNQVLSLKKADLSRHVENGRANVETLAGDLEVMLQSLNVWPHAGAAEMPVADIEQLEVLGRPLVGCQKARITRLLGHSARFCRTKRSQADEAPDQERLLTWNAPAITYLRVKSRGVV